MICRHGRIDPIEDPTPPEEILEPDYVKKLREALDELTERVRTLEEHDRHYHGGNSDDE
jgi:hypothetical protein